MMAYAMCLVLFSTEGFLIYNLAYLNLEPKFQCVSASGNSTACTRLDTCSPEYNFLI